MTAPAITPTPVRFHLGVHQPAWMEHLDFPLFVSNRRLMHRKSLPRAAGPWALDSGAFSEVDLYGRWKTTAQQYATAVNRYHDEIGNLEWCSPMDWVCEPWMLPKTGLTIEEHLRRTVDSVVELRSLGIKSRVIPVLQGWLRSHYLRCAEMYADAGIDLLDEPLVGVGSMCRRQNHWRASLLLDELARLGGEGAPLVPLHAFGFKIQGLTLSRSLASADSMAWSSAGRRERGCSPTHTTESNCMSYALWWRTHLMERLEDAGVPTCAA
ncbi:hypothetical protein ACFYNO_15525 [Kitasatospora sp. NPDC006697]|uniref:deazapurine DNA modification protein DpdA family protein n=1 Tax=unclassified Kitasatospora TaxID=2633591 RepID=UPI00367AB7FF